MRTKVFVQNPGKRKGFIGTFDIEIMKFGGAQFVTLKNKRYRVTSIGHYFEKGRINEQQLDVESIP